MSAKKTEQAKQLAGTNQPCRASEVVIDFPLLQEVPEPPAWLPNLEAQFEWLRLAPILHANKLLHEGTVNSLGHLCALHGSVLAEYALGKMPNSSAIATLRTLFNDFGLTPISQSKVKPQGLAEKKDNPFMRNAKRG